MAQAVVNSLRGSSMFQPLCGSSFHGDSLQAASQARFACQGKRRSHGLVVARGYIDGSVADHYATLGVNPGAPRHEIKKAYRRLALQYHPDVCSGEHCIRKFQQINRAYENVLNGTTQFGQFDDDLSDNLEGFMGVGDDSWEDWEEWMGWEGAGTYDYSNHVNASI